jgi:pilus assembly protein CpaB
MKRNLAPLLGVAFVVAVLSTVIFYGLFVSKLKSAPVLRVVVAAKPLRPGLTIAKSDLSTISWSGAEVPRGMMDDPARVTGQIVLQPIDEGEPILESRLASASGARLGVPSGMRAVSVHVSDSSGVLALLKPGYRVDIQVFAVRQGEKLIDSEARTAFQNIPVLAINLQPESSSLGGFNAPVVTLLASPAEADGLGAADSFGRIRLILRNPIDSGREAKPVIPFNSVLRGVSAKSF